MKLHSSRRPARRIPSPSRRRTTMTNMRIVIGPAHVGDQSLSRDVFRRVALNFGTLPARDHMPLEPALARRINPPYRFATHRCTSSHLPRRSTGDALRPGEAPTAPTPEFTAPVTGTGSGVIPPPYDPYRSGFPSNLYPSLYNMPGLPFPYGPATPADMTNPY